MPYKEKTVNLSFTLKYPDKTSFTYSNIMLSADDASIIDVADAMNSLQDVPYSDITRTEVTNIYFQM